MRNAEENTTWTSETLEALVIAQTIHGRATTSLSTTSISTLPTTSTILQGQAQEGERLPIPIIGLAECSNTLRLTAIMLGRLRMTVEEAKSQYILFGNSVFGQARWFHVKSPLWSPRPKYPTRKIRRAVLEVIRIGLRNPNAVPYEVESEQLAMPSRHEKRCHW